jgi:hypothetical protein
MRWNSTLVARLPSPRKNSGHCSPFYNVLTQCIFLWVDCTSFYTSNPLSLHVWSEHSMYLESLLLDRFLRATYRPSISTALLRAKLSRIFRVACVKMSTAIVVEMMNINEMRGYVKSYRSHSSSSRGPPGSSPFTSTSIRSSSLSFGEPSARRFLCWKFKQLSDHATAMTGHCFQQKNVSHSSLLIDI